MSASWNEAILRQSQPEPLTKPLLAAPIPLLEPNGATMDGLDTISMLTGLKAGRLISATRDYGRKHLAVPIAYAVTAEDPQTGTEDLAMVFGASGIDFVLKSRPESELFPQLTRRGGQPLLVVSGSPHIPLILARMQVEPQRFGAELYAGPGKNPEAVTRVANVVWQRAATSNVPRHRA